MKQSGRYLDGTRRGFLGAALALAGGAVARLAQADEQPQVNPRAIAGDVVEPKWESRLTVTVGPQKADLVGTDEKVIQAAIDYMAGWGGGTVRILPGTYRLRNAVALRSGVRILGSGSDSVLVKAPEAKTNLAEDSHFYDQEVTLADAGGFQVGDGVCLRVDNSWHKGHCIIRRTLVARTGNRFKLDRPLEDDEFLLKGNAHVMTLFPLISGEGVNDAAIENIALDGNKANQESLDHHWGNVLAGVWLMRSNRIQIRKVKSLNSAADGVAWQMSHDVLVEDCHCHDNVSFGLHPGSGSQRSLVRGNRLERNYIGFYFCHGAKYGLVEKNVIVDSLTSGVSIGQKDTDNIIRDNEIRGSKEVGVLFRALDPSSSPHRNRLAGNVILDNGGESGIGIDVQGQVETVTLARNQIRETRQPLKRIGIRIGSGTKNVKLVENRIEGFSVAVSDLRKSAGQLLNQAGTHAL
ncbi:MAG: right-handed parallel beta-helix repeat-containing protein [Acidobacteria bacterium]|nr:right-handed parallel beta-helix repeat-containing protein [Acidobacteriota bacterium]